MPNNTRNGNNRALPKRNNVPKNVVDAMTKNLPKGTFGAVGSALGAPFGPTGALVGGLLGNGLATITGRGDYTVTANTLAKDGGALSSIIPSFSTTGGGRNVRVRHRECFGTVNAPAVPETFRNLEYVVNPANASMFPWLSHLARNYEKYKLHGAVVYYESSSSDYASNTAMGTVILATNYNSAERAWADDISMLNAEFSVGCKPSVNQAHPLECKVELGASGYLYVRDLASNSPGTTVDPRLYDVGKFQVATKGLTAPAGAELGRLWITYDVEFVRPLMSPSGSMQYGYAALNGVDFSTVGSGLSGVVSSVGSPFLERQAVSSGVVPNITPASVLITTAGPNIIELEGYACRDGIYTFTWQGIGTGFGGAGGIDTFPAGGAQAQVLNTFEVVASAKTSGSASLLVTGANGRTNAYVRFQLVTAQSAGTCTSAIVTVSYIDGTGAIRSGV